MSPNFLWDNSKYILGVTKKDDKLSQKKQEKIAEHAVRCFETFKAYHLDQKESCNDEGYRALLLFLEKWRPENFENAKLYQKSAS